MNETQNERDLDWNFLHLLLVFQPRGDQVSSASSPQTTQVLPQLCLPKVSLPFTKVHLTYNCSHIYVCLQTKTRFPFFSHRKLGDGFIERWQRHFGQLWNVENQHCFRSAAHFYTFLHCCHFFPERGRFKRICVFLPLLVQIVFCKCWVDSQICGLG